MEIRSLELRLVDADLAPITKLLAAEIADVEDLALRFAPEGIVASGLYPTPLMKVSFETAWSLRPAGADLRLKMESLKVMGIPGGFLRGMLVKMAKDAISDQPGVRVEGEEIVVTLAEVLQEKGIEVRADFKRAELGAGEAVIGC
ncbi:MAG: hypothetical protein K2W96_09310 [Gemmataceae bacterium]|nr:hypothetical protein [Gemmataceae bacterium]